MKLNQFDYFRAIAILFIVFAHTAQVLLDVYSNKSFLISFIYTLIGGGSTLFVFISGFFFHYVFYHKFEYKTFMVKKLKGIYVPYLFLTTIAFLGFYLLQLTKEVKNISNEVAIGISQQNSVTDVFLLYLSHIVNGTIFIQYWYIPFIMLIFLASPIFIIYIKSSIRLRMSIMLLLFVISLLIHRPLNLGNTIHSFVYYLPVYMLGINYSIHRKSLNLLINDKSTIFGFLVIFMLGIQLVIFDHVGTYRKDDPFYFNGISLMLVQKVFLIFFFLSLLQIYEKKENRLLKEIAASSFAIFFLHMFFLQLLLKLKVDLFLSFIPDLIKWLVISVLVVITSYLFAYCVKYIFKKNSKFLTGW